MKIENGKLVFEVVKCTMCESTGKARRGIHCANYNKKQRGKPCEICGSKNKWDHKIVDHEIVDCMFCNGKGEKMEDRFSHIAKDLVEPIIGMINFSFRSPDNRNISLDQRFISACYSKRNSFAGSQDYLDHTLSSPVLILDKVLKQVRRGYTHQALNYIDAENNILTEIHYWGYNGGFTAAWDTN